ncbi:ATP-binding protein [Foetidibacter luteolus]|uniref:ATP-binding protein n=1 Tax=Foetidibacter luteolus TaxID=2608880 RepID=UPI00129A85F8|nr:ATP-binding protein [Foetidibacter luteolus]
MKLKVAERIRIGYMTAVILLFIAFLLNFYTSRELIKLANNVNHTTSVLNNLEILVSHVKDGERGMRGYLLFNDESFLAPYHRSHAQADSIIRVLKTNLTDKEQLGTLEKVKQLVRQRYAALAFALNTFRDSGLVVTNDIRKSAYEERVVMDSLKMAVMAMQAKEKQVIQTPARQLGSYSSVMRVINTTSLVIAIFLSIYSVMNYNRENTQKEEANKKADDYRLELEKRIEQLNRVNQELVELKSIEKFAATGRIARTIAHEVRNPLTNISLACEQLRNEVEQNDETGILFSMIERNSTRINQLITDLLNSTKFAQLEYSRISINDLMDETLENAKDRLELNGIKLQKYYTDVKCEISVDKEKMKIAFLNIIVNAVEAMSPQHGILKIRTESKNNQCLIRISDNGKGMNEDTVSRLFEPYFTSKQKGNGLGLTNTQNIILNHKGSISVQSAPAKGTTFTITLNLS